MVFAIGRFELTGEPPNHPLVLFVTIAVISFAYAHLAIGIFSLARDAL
jgi:hypothetical protein